MTQLIDSSRDETIRNMETVLEDLYRARDIERRERKAIQPRTGPFHVVWVDAWDEEAGEALSCGRCIVTVEGADDLPLAMAEARRETWAWGGELVVTDDDGDRVYL